MGMYDLNWGLVDTKFPQELVAPFDPYVIAEKQNKLAMLAGAQQLQNQALQEGQFKIADRPNTIAQNESARQLQAMQLAQAAEQLKRAPVIAGREELIYQQAQKEAQRKQAINDRLANATPEQLNDPVWLKQTYFQVAPEQAVSQLAKPNEGLTLSPLTKLMREKSAIEAANPNDPRIKIYDAAIRKESETAQQIVPHIQAAEPLVSVVGPDGMTPTLVPRSQAIGMKPWTQGQSLKPIPPVVNAAIIANSQSRKQIDNALNLLEGKTVGGLKGDTEATGWKGYLPQAVLNRIDPSGVATRAMIADIGSMKIHDRSGAAVTINEAPRLVPFIPQATDKDETVKIKLQKLKQEIENETNALGSTYSAEQGYRPSPILQNSAPSAYESNAHPADIQELLGKYGSKK